MPRWPLTSADWWPPKTMAFTVAHAAAALPLRRLNLVWSAFVVGSMAPDFLYAIGSVKYRSLGHNFPGVVLFTIPAAFAMLWFFHFAVKKTIAGLLPIGMQQRLNAQLGEFRFGGERRTLTIGFSIILGIATHLLWDSFTHAYTWPWRHLAWLQSQIDLPVAGRIPAYGFLQYASTFIGLFALGVWTLLWYRDTAPATGSASPPYFKSRAWLAVVMISIAGAAGFLRAAMLASPPVGASATIQYWDWYVLHFSVTALAVAFWELLFYCLITTSREYSNSRFSSA